ncbi:hypothetical protein OFM39_35710, partial [Escherichia coli]|nr:hypothetical protein [Escherichia coli]
QLVITIKEVSISQAVKLEYCMNMITFLFFVYFLKIKMIKILIIAFRNSDFVFIFNRNRFSIIEDIK